VNVDDVRERVKDINLAVLGEEERRYVAWALACVRHALFVRGQTGIVDETELKMVGTNLWRLHRDLGTEIAFVHCARLVQDCVNLVQFGVRSSDMMSAMKREMDWQNRLARVALIDRYGGENPEAIVLWGLPEGYTDSLGMLETDDLYTATVYREAWAKASGKDIEVREFEKNGEKRYFVILTDEQADADAFDATMDLLDGDRALFLKRADVATHEAHGSYVDPDDPDEIDIPLQGIEDIPPEEW